MAPNRRVAEQHEDWLNLTDPEAPWFSLPVIKRAFPNGLDQTPPEIRAEHKARWYGDDGVTSARTAADRSDYLNWLLCDVLGWGDRYLKADSLSTDFVQGVTRYDVTVRATGVYQPAASAPVGLFDGPTEVPVWATAAVRALVFVLPINTDPRSRPTVDTWPASWVQRAALACRHHNVPLALVTDGDYLTLVHAPGGATTGWGSWRASEFATEPVLLDSFRSMLHARRFTGVPDKDSPAALLAESAGTQAEVTDQLGSQVRKATELLVNAISRANRDRGETLLRGVAPHEVYEAAVTVMMRTVFLLVAEENDLLPVDNLHYQQLYAIRTLRETLLTERFDNPEVLETRTTAWHRLLATSRAVHSGVHHDELTVPAYGGNLFDPDRFPFLEGRSKGDTWRTSTGTPIPVTDLDVLAILDALLVLRFTSAGGVADTRRLSYRHVDAEQIGHIYERLLDHDAVVAEKVVLGLKGKAGDEPEVGLPTLEAKLLEGSKVLVSFLSDKDAKKGGCYVGTANQVARLLADSIDGHLRAGLIQACQGDLSLAKRIEPFANLVRLDLRDRPIVFLAGAVYVTETGSRRDSGTAYTTRELADEVVEHALAPLAYSPGPQDTPNTNEWRVRPSAEILGLRICDPAVGSGAVIVAGCRYLAERLIQAWRVEGDPRAAETATAADDPTRLDVVVEARRLIAEQCCYGVDRNPMAVEMAKLSMWLTTVAKDRPFTFLDHAMKSGDSLLGMWNMDQLRYLHYDVQAGRGRRLPIAGWSAGGDALRTIERLVDEALELRREVQAIDTRSPADIERKQKLHTQSEARLALLSVISDAVAGAALSASGERNPVVAMTQKIEADADLIAMLMSAIGTPEEQAAASSLQGRARLRLNAGRPLGAPERHPMHWPISFPEVFTGKHSGFDAMIGNPPFVGGKKISGAAGSDYRNHLVTWVANGVAGNADLVSYFFLDAMRLSHSLGYLATNTIAQGDTSEVGLTQLVDGGWTINRAVSSTNWPGDATLEISKVWATSNPWAGSAILDDRPVVGIDEMLYPKSRSGWRKQRLRSVGSEAFVGSALNTEAFLVTETEAHSILLGSPESAEVLAPFVNGEELNSSVSGTGTRFAINFRDLTERAASRYEEVYQLAVERVLPEVRGKGASYEGWIDRWWQFWRVRPELYSTISEFERVLAMALTSKVVQPRFVSPSQVFSHAVVVFAYDDYFHFGVLTSGFHFRWAVRFSSSMRTDTRYTPSDVFETFAQPTRTASVAAAGEALDRHRASAMARRNIGLTNLYNLVHNPAIDAEDISRLRQLHVNLDFAMRDAYGWSDLDLQYSFNDVRGQGIRFTFEPNTADEVLDRLLELNKVRYEAEVRDGTQGRRGGKVRKGAPNQDSLLGDDE